jgi:CheY-like chemotaxis protein
MDRATEGGPRQARALVTTPLPAEELAQAVEQLLPEPPAPVVVPVRGTVLVVEDNGGVRSLIDAILRREGYAILGAASGAEGLEVCRGHAGPIDLLITDLGLPKMNGREVARAVTALRPGVRVLFVSGYVAPDEPGAGHFLAKPFLPAELLEKVRTLLAREPGA